LEADESSVRDRIFRLKAEATPVENLKPNQIFRLQAEATRVAARVGTH
jgi:hypothetical protein